MKNKGTLITIVILLVACLPLAIYGTYMGIQNKNVVIDDNPTKEFIHNNKVYFYKNDMLVSTYACADDCSIIKEEINDVIYNINYYKFGNMEPYTMLNDEYALFREGKRIVLFSISAGKEILSFNSLKYYSVEQTNPILIVENNGKYGVLSLNDMLAIIPTTYDFIGIPNRINNKVLDTSKFIANQGRYWYVLDSDGTYKHAPFSNTIVDFNDNYIVTLNNRGYQIYDYENNAYLETLNMKSVFCIGNYVLVITNTNTLMVYTDLNAGSINNITLTNYTDITFDYHENKIDIYLDGNNYQSLVL